MQVFINEKSLHGQFNMGNLKASMQNFISTLKTINESVTEKKIYTSKLIYNCETIQGVNLGTTLNERYEWKSVFLQNIKGMKIWEKEMVHSLDSSYTHNNIEYRSTSLAEHTERKSTPEGNGFMVNFVLSMFGNTLSVTVTKDNTATIDLCCVYDEDTVFQWLIENGFIDPNAAYDLRSQTPPRDFQTVLKDSETFQFINRYNQGRKVYRRIGTSELWVVDNLHHGNDAHIEVFDENTTLHLGVSKHNVINLLTAFRTPGRVISL